MTVVRIVCAWCGMEQGWKEVAGDDDRATHTMCADCFEQEVPNTAACSTRVGEGA